VPTSKSQADDPDGLSVKAAAKAHGFVDSPVKPRRRGTDYPRRSFKARISVSAQDRFVAWCEAERMSYREGFERLVGMIR
jgi:hypothetical protein